MDIALHLLYVAGAAALSDPNVTRIIMTGVTLGLGWAGNKFLGKYMNAQDRATAQQAIVAGVQEVMPVAAEYLSRTTALSPAGSRSAAEEEDLRNQAIAKATEIAKHSGVELEKVLAPTLIRATLEHAVDAVRGKVAPVPSLSPGVKALLPLLLCMFMLTGCGTLTHGQLPLDWGKETVADTIQVADSVTEYLRQPGHESGIIAVAHKDAANLYHTLRDSGADKEEAIQRAAIDLLTVARRSLPKGVTFDDYCRKELNLPATVGVTSIVVGIIYSGLSSS